MLAIGIENINLKKTFMHTGFFQIPNLEVSIQTDNKSGDYYFLFRNLSEGFITELRYNPFNFSEDTYWQSISEKVKTLLFNRIKFDAKGYKDKSDLIDFIQLNTPTYTPGEKMNFVLEYISELTNYDGEAISLNLEVELNNKEIWRKYYFANGDEFWFYIQNLRSQEYITFDGGRNSLRDLKLSIKGLTSVIDLNSQKQSRICFVAMSFHKDLESVFTEAIQPALEKTGFIPYILTNENVDSHVTINDAIIAGIKKAHFTIADFTQHKAGVYFEAGYALGRGQKVIYTCRHDDISSAHFDTRNYQHIVWETTEDLKSKLIDKINAQIIP